MKHDSLKTAQSLKNAELNTKQAEGIANALTASMVNTMDNKDLELAFNKQYLRIIGSIGLLMTVFKLLDYIPK